MSAVVEKALWLIEHRYGQELTLEAMAEHIGVSRFYLSRSFPAATGMSISADSRRIQSTSLCGATTSSPPAPIGASSNTERPPFAIARPMPNSSSSAANVPGTGSPSIAR